MLVTVLTGVLLSAAGVQQTDTVISVQPGMRLDIESFAGEVVIGTWSRDEMRIVADHSTRTELVIRQTGSIIRLRTESWRGPASVDYEITIPATMDVEVAGTFTSARITGIEGEVRVQTTQGDVIVQGGRGIVSLSSTTGDVELEGAQGRITAQTVSGSVRVIDAQGEITAETTSGSLTLDRVQSARVEATAVAGSVYYTGTIEDDGRYFLSTHSGNVVLAVPGTFNATVSAATFSGGFDSAFPVTLTGTRDRGRRFDFTLGTGSARVELQSFSGNIELRRAGGGGR